MDIHAVRRARLRHLANQFGNDAALARAAELDPAHLSRLIGQHPKSQLGTRLARTIESRLSLAIGWLDNLDETTQHLSDKFATLPQAQQTLIGKLLDRPIDDAAANALTTLIDRL